MKTILFACLLIPLALLAQAPEATKNSNDWNYDLEKALLKAKKKDKKVLLYFTGSDWCMPCKQLKKDFFDTPTFQEISEPYVLVYVDFPRNQDLLSTKQRQHNQEVIAKHNKKGVFPLLKVLDDRGKTLDEYSGYAMNGDVRYHVDLLEKNK
ncbi:thioredoxin family protein [Maribacter sp. 2307ULW6-5]|uniref:thioredoxin family protein n=1 Tax=Maribacter sp. 2307ULW6-5 TaxID=3386275 RepID=UPI0039BCE96A